MAMLDFLIPVVREVGTFLLHSLGHAQSIQFKGRANLVTEMDRRSEANLIRAIRTQYPEHAILSEEAGALPGSAGQPEWVLDPLDGTTNYVHGLPYFCIALALRQGPQLQAGMIYAPYVDELYWAERGRGAFMNNQPLHVSTTPVLDDALLTTGFPSDLSRAPDTNIEHFLALMPKTRAIRRMGSASLDLCNVAAGRLDGFWQPTMPVWDVGPGAIIVEEAGGRVTDFAGNSGLYEGSIAASNGQIHAALVEVLQRG
ncbi:MAG TPA: inositol monophosphatase family protein [Candidatus Tectomicrobia bacterium]|nr:inositol monophosphatase family protein [Candidatus Tectomicrobia bacterium]